jgi:hypothetical protein
MKAKFKFFFIILLFSFLDVNAQLIDSTSRVPIMNKRSLIFIAEIETKIGVQKGILYKADSSEIMILDSLYQQVSIPIKTIVSFKLKRSNAEWFGFKAGIIFGFAIFEALPIAIALQFPTSHITISAILALTGVTLLNGLIFGIVSSIIPNIKINKNFSERYLKKMKRIQSKSQAFFIKRIPKKVRLV